MTTPDLGPVRHPETEIYVHIVPISPGRYVSLGAPWPLTPDEWANLTTILDAFRPGLVDGAINRKAARDSELDGRGPSPEP